MKRWLWLTEFCALVPERALCGPQSKTPQALLLEAFLILAPRPGLEPGTYGFSNRGLLLISTRIIKTIFLKSR